MICSFKGNSVYWSPGTTSVSEVGVVYIKMSSRLLFVLIYGLFNVADFDFGKEKLPKQHFSHALGWLTVENGN